MPTTQSTSSDRGRVGSAGSTPLHDTDAGLGEPPHRPPNLIGTGGSRFGPSATLILNVELPARPVALNRSEIGFSHLGGAIDPAPGTDTFVGYLIWVRSSRPLPINTELLFLEPDGGRSDMRISGSLLDDLNIVESSRALVLVCDDSRIFQLDPDLTVLPDIDLDMLPSAALLEYSAAEKPDRAEAARSAVMPGSVATAERTPENYDVVRVQRGFAIIENMKPNSLVAVSDEGILDIVCMVNSLNALARGDAALANPARAVEAAAKGLITGIKAMRDTAEPGDPSKPPTKLERMASQSLRNLAESHLSALKNLAAPVRASVMGEIGLAD